MPSLDDIPDEIVRHVLLFVSPEDNLRTVQHLAKRLGRIANEPLLWRYHCHRAYKYWAPRHVLPLKLAAQASDVAWKELWIERKRLDTRSARLFDGLLSTKVGRLRKLGKICELGYDAKDFLLAQLHTDDGVEDVLARRYGLYTAEASRRLTWTDTTRIRRWVASTGVWPLRSGTNTKRESPLYMVSSGR